MSLARYAYHKLRVNTAPNYFCFIFRTPNKSKFFLPWPPTAARFPNAYQFSPQEDHFEKTTSNSSASRSSNQHLVSYSRMGGWSPTLAQAVDLCAFWVPVTVLGNTCGLTAKAAILRRSVRHVTHFGICALARRLGVTECNRVPDVDPTTLS